MQGCGGITAEPCPCGISHSSLLVHAHPHHPFSYQGEVLCISSASSRALWVPREKNLQSPVPTSCHPCVGTPSCHQHPGQEQLRGARQERVAAPHISSMNFAAFATPEAPANTSARSRFYFISAQILFQPRFYFSAADEGVASQFGVCTRFVQLWRQQAHGDGGGRVSPAPQFQLQMVCERQEQSWGCQGTLERGCHTGLALLGRSEQGWVPGWDPKRWAEPHPQLGRGGMGHPVPVPGKGHLSLCHPAAQTVIVTCQSDQTEHPTNITCWG